VRPSLGNVEGDVTGFLGLLGRHSLDVHDPRWEVTTLDSVEHVDDVVIGGSQNRALLEPICSTHRQVITNEIPVTLPGVELDTKPEIFSF